MGIFCLSVNENVDQHKIKKAKKKKRKGKEREKKRRSYIDRLTNRRREKERKGTITPLINLIFHNKCKKNLSILILKKYFDSFFLLLLRFQNITVCTFRLMILFDTQNKN